MADPKVVLPDALKRLQFCTDNVVEATENLALQINGHPKAQNFDPRGSSNDFVPLQYDQYGQVRPDKAVALGKELRRQADLAHRAIRRIEQIIATNLHAVRPKFDPTDPNEYCRMHLQLDEYLYRYRGDRCRSCYERVLTLRDNGLNDDITLDDLRHHQQRGRWPQKAADPNQPPPMKQPLPRRIAGLDNLVDGLTQIQEAQ